MATDSATRCRTVSVDPDGTCVFSSSFEYSGKCPGVLLKVRLDRFGYINAAKRNNADVVTTYADKSPNECKALCQSKSDCINVYTDCADDPKPGCELLEDRDTTGDADVTEITPCDDDRTEEEKSLVLEAFQWCSFSLLCVP